MSHNRQSLPRIRSVSLNCVTLVNILVAQSASLALPDEPQWQPLSRSDEITTLELMSARLKENDSRIRTWTGSYRMEEMLLLSGRIAEDLARVAHPDVPADGTKYLKLERALCRFSIDSAIDSIYAALEADAPPQLLDAHSGEPVEVSLARPFQKSILTPKEFLRFDPEQRHGPFKEFPEPPLVRKQDRDRVVFREPPKAAEDTLNSIGIDPRKFLFDYPSNDTLGAYAAQFQSTDPKVVEHLRQNELLVRQGSVEGDTRFHVSYHSPPSSRRVISVERVFSERAGFHPIEESLYLLPARTLVQRVEWDWREVGGVLIPSRHMRRLLTDDGSTSRFERTCVLVECRVNQPIEPKTFTLAQFDLKEDDRILDYIDGAQARIRGGTPVMISPDVPGFRWGRFWNIFAFTFPFGFIVFALLAYRHRRRASVA